MSNTLVRLTTDIRPQTAPTSVRVRTFPFSSDASTTLGNVHVSWGEDFTLLFNVQDLEHVETLAEALQEAVAVARAFVAKGGQDEQRWESQHAGLFTMVDPYA